jgi:hypothetical protein
VLIRAGWWPHSDAHVCACFQCQARCFHAWRRSGGCGSTSPSSALTSSRAHPRLDQPTACVCSGLRRRQPSLGQPLPIFQKGVLGFLYKVCHLAKLVGSFAPHSEMRSSNPFRGKASPFYFLFCQIRHQPGSWPIRASLYVTSLRRLLSITTQAQVWSSFYFFL